MLHRRHVDFRLTPPANKLGRHVKKRLARIAVLGYAAAITMFFVCFVSPIWWAESLGDVDPAWIRPEFLLVAYVTVPLLVYIGTLWAVSKVAVWLGWMTRAESHEFPLSGRCWPNSWLEPDNGGLKAKPVPEKESLAAVSRWEKWSSRGMVLVAMSLWLHLLCVIATAVVLLTEPLRHTEGLWGGLAKTVFVLIAGTVFVCPLLALYFIARSRATPGQRMVVLLLEAWLLSVHLFVFVSLVAAT